MTKRLFSVIIPCYNTGSYIDICMESVLNQTIGLENIEIIIVDDASGDNVTIEKLRKYENRYPDNIVLILNEANVGPGGCRNIGIEYASGEYMAYVDSDDWVDAHAFERLYDYAKEYDADVVEYGFSVTIVHDGKETHDRNNGKMPVLYEIDDIAKRKDFVLPYDSHLVGWNKIYRTSLIRDNKICYAEHISYEEPPFSYLVRFFSERYLIVPDELYYYYKRPGSMSDIERYKKNRFDIVKGYQVMLDEIINKGQMTEYKEEAEFIFWCGAFYLPMFNMATAGSFYTKDEYDDIREIVSSRVYDICSNSYFRKTFANLEVLGRITYLPASDTVYSDIKELFVKLAAVE